MTSQPIPQEYFLVGSIMDSSLDVLLHRLRGLCDQLEPLQGTVDAHPVAALAAHQRGHSVQTFHEHEQIYSVKTNVHGAPTQLRVRRSLDPHLQSAPYHLRYLGTSENEKAKSVMTRQYISVSCNDAVVPIIEHGMGFRFDYELVIKGFLFRKGKMKVIVSKLYKMPNFGKVDQIESMTQSHMVELSVVGPPGGAAGSSDPLGDDMKAFADILKPLVNLEKIDARRF